MPKTKKVMETKPQDAPANVEQTNGKAKRKKKGEPKEPVAAERPVIYPDVKVEKHIGDNELTEEQAKVLLGWNEVPKGAEYTLTDHEDKNIRLDHNPRNRKFEMALALMYAQLILERQWKLNGETMVVGRTGLIISAQHRGAGLVLACQLWRKEPDKWSKWDKSPTLPCLIVYGIDESDEVVNTIDTGRPRTFGDVIYRSEFFAKEDAATRDVLSNILSQAVKLLEHRTKAREGALSAKRPHAEGLEFLDRHLYLLKCVRHIKEENGKNNLIAKYMPLGYAAALLYLMSCGSTDPKEYRTTLRDESLLDFSNRDLAMDFFTHIGQRADQFKAFYDIGDEMFANLGMWPRDEAIGHLINVWLLLTDGKKITKESIALDIEIDPAIGKRKIKINPKVGGIDYGYPDKDEASEDDPTETEIQTRAAVVKRKKDQPAPEVGMQVWCPEDGGHFTGKVSEIYDGPKGMVAKIRMKNKKETEFPLDQCLTVDPNNPDLN